MGSRGWCLIPQHRVLSVPRVSSSGSETGLDGAVPGHAVSSPSSQSKSLETLISLMRSCYPQDTNQADESLACLAWVPLPSACQALSTEDVGWGLCQEGASSHDRRPFLCELWVQGCQLCWP